MGNNRNPLAGPHLVRYGIAADQEYLVGDFLSTYDQLILNANIVAHMPNALASFLLQRAKGKPYIIDPQTHAFQHDIEHLTSKSDGSKGKIKRSIKGLMDAYGQPILSRIGKNMASLLPGDFNPGVRKGFCKRVVEFQINAISKHAKKSDASKYYDFLKDKKIIAGTQIKPSIIVAPYFYMTDVTLPSWLPVNAGCVKDCRRLFPKEPLAAQIVITKDILSDLTLRKKITTAYSKAPPDYIFLWVDGLQEDTSSQATLIAFIDTIEALGKIAPVVNLYGGFFSIALMNSSVVDNFCGVAHGLEYGEHREVIPVGGGLPSAKYYFPKVHKRLLFRDALRAARAVGGMKDLKSFFSNVCGCKECRSVISTPPETSFKAFGESRPIWISKGDSGFYRDFPYPQTRDHTVRHYMWCKQLEYDMTIDINIIATELRAAAKRLKRSLGLDGVSNCNVWASALRAKAKS